MSARDRILGAVGRLVLRATSDVEVKDAATHRASSGRDYVFGGQPITSNWDVERAVRDGYEKVIWVFKAIDAIAEKTSGWPLLVVDESDEGVTKPIDDPIVPLLNARANVVDGPAKNFRYRLSSQLLLSKQGVFVEVIPSKGGGIAALNLLPPGRTRPIPDPDTFVAGFEVTLANGDKITLKPYDERTKRGVIWIRKPHPTDPYSSVTPLEPAGISIDLDQYMRLYNLHFLRNDGRQGQLVSVRGGLTPEDAQELKQRFSGGIGSVGRTTVIEADAISVQDTAISPRDAQYAELRSITKEDLLIALGTPESVLGNASGRTFDNADAERESWLRDTVLAHARVIEGALEVLTEGGWSDERRLRHDTTKEWVLNREKRADQAKAAADFTAGLITAEEYRDLLGHERIDSAAARVLWIAGGKAAVGSEEDQKAAAELKPMGGGGAAPPAAGADPAALAATSRAGALAGAARGQELAATARRDTNTQAPGQPGVRALAAVKALPAQQKCSRCSEQAVARVIHSEGMAYIPACAEHLAAAKDAAARSVPGDTPDPSNVDAVRGMDGRPYQEKALTDCPACLDWLNGGDGDGRHECVEGKGDAAGIEFAHIAVDEKKFNARQPRYPKGHPKGGQWMSAGDTALWLKGKPLKGGFDSSKVVDPNAGTIFGGGTSSQSTSAADAPLAYPKNYPYPRVVGAPPATALAAPKPIKAVSLRPGDVVNHKGKQFSVVTNKAGKSGQNTLELVADDGDEDTISQPSQSTLTSVARTPHPTKVAAARKANANAVATPTEITSRSYAAPSNTSVQSASGSSAPASAAPPAATTTITPAQSGPPPVSARMATVVASAPTIPGAAPAVALPQAAIQPAQSLKPGDVIVHPNSGAPATITSITPTTVGTTQTATVGLLTAQGATVWPGLQRATVLGVSPTPAVAPSAPAAAPAAPTPAPAAPAAPAAITGSAIGPAVAGAWSNGSTPATPLATPTVVPATQLRAGDVIDVNGVAVTVRLGTASPSAPGGMNIMGRDPQGNRITLGSTTYRQPPLTSATLIGVSSQTNNPISGQALAPATPGFVGTNAPAAAAPAPAPAAPSTAPTSGAGAVLGMQLNPGDVISINGGQGTATVVGRTPSGRVQIQPNNGGSQRSLSMTWQGTRISAVQGAQSPMAPATPAPAATPSVSQAIPAVTVQAPAVPTPNPTPAPTVANPTPAGGTPSIAAQTSPSILTYPTNYPYPQVTGAPPANDLAQPKSIKTVSLRPGDVIQDPGTGVLVSVVSNRKVGGAQVITVQDDSGTQTTYAPIPPSIALTAVARTPHPTAVAAARRAQRGQATPQPQAPASPSQAAPGPAIGFTNPAAPQAQAAASVAANSGDSPTIAKAPAPGTLGQPTIKATPVAQVKVGQVVEVGGSAWTVTENVVVGGKREVWGVRPGIDDPNQLTQDATGAWRHGTKIPGVSRGNVDVVNPPIVPAANVPTGGAARDHDPDLSITRTQIGSGAGAFSFASQPVPATKLKAGDVIAVNGKESQGSFVVTKVDVDSLRGTGGQAVFGRLNGTGPEEQLFLAAPHGGPDREVRVQVNGPAEQAPISRPKPPRTASTITRNDISDPATQAKIAGIYSTRRASVKFPAGSTGKDPILANLMEERGFHAKPDVVSEADLDQYVAAGEVEMWRGIVAAQSGDLSEQFRTGDHFVGGGMYGNGTYTAYGYSKKGDASLDSIKFTQGRYATGSTSQHVRMTLKADARIVEYDSLVREQQRMRKSTDPAVKAIGDSGDVSHAAVYLGYDAIRKSNAYDSGTQSQTDFKFGFMVVLNRSAVRVSEQNRNSGSGAGKRQKNGQKALSFSDSKHGTGASRNVHKGVVDVKVVGVP